MNYYKLSLDDKIGIAETAIVNARRDPVIMEKIAVYGYDEERLEKGMNLVVTVKKISLRWDAAQVGKKLAARELRETARVLKNRCGQTRKAARLALRNLAPQMRALGLDQESKRGLAQWLEQTRQFYANALDVPGILDRLSYFGIDAQRLEDERGPLETVEIAMANSEKKAAEAMQVTKERKQAIAELNRWMIDFFVILRMALGKSQRLEALGLVIKN